MGHQASRALCIRSGARIDAVVPPGRTKMLGYFFSRGAFEADWFSGALCGPRFVSGAGHSGCVRSKKPDFSPSSKVFQPTTRSAASAQQAASRKEEEDRATIIRDDQNAGACLLRLPDGTTTWVFRGTAVEPTLAVEERRMGNLNGPAASSDVPNDGAPVIRRKLDMEDGLDKDVSAGRTRAKTLQQNQQDTDRSIDLKMQPPIPQRSPATLAKEDSKSGEDESDDDEEEEGDEWTNASGMQSKAAGKKKAGKRKKKKGKGKGGDANKKAANGKPAGLMGERPRSSSEPRHVSWGRVHITSFERKLSIDSVPAHGAWPLGLGEAAEKGHVETSIDEYEVKKEEDISKRIQELPKKLRKVATGETRQYDYKASKERNPVFGPLDEKDRKMALLQSICLQPKHETKMSNVEEVEKVLCVELNDIRASRKNVGCSCHHSKSPDKLSLKKLKEELHRRHMSAQGNDKAKLAAMLKEAMANERLCTQEACECFLAGVPCHADVCGCCAGGGKRGKLDCCNPKGNFCYQEQEVRSYRHSILQVPSSPRPRSVTMP